MPTNTITAAPHFPRVIGSCRKTRANRIVIRPKSDAATAAYSDRSSDPAAVTRPSAVVSRTPINTKGGKRAAAGRCPPRVASSNRAIAATAAARVHRITGKSAPNRDAACPKAKVVANPRAARSARVIAWRSDVNQNPNLRAV